MAASNFKRRLIGFLRVGLCVAALGLVVGSVSLHDEIRLTDGIVITGTVIESAYPMEVLSSDGERRIVTESELAHGPDGESAVNYGLLSTWGGSNKDLLLVGLLIFAIVPFLQGYRIQILSRAEEIPITFGDGLRLSFAGNFLNFAAPFGSTAGDVFKAYYLARYTPRKAEAMTVVFVDRLIGLVTLLVAVAIVVVFSAEASPLAPIRAHVFVMTAVGVIGAACYLSSAFRNLRISRYIVERLPKADLLARVDQVVLRLWRRQSVLWMATLSTFVLHVLCALSFVALALALGMRAGIADSVDYFAFFSAGELIKALPGPPQGLGTAELAYTYFFAPFGTVSQILCAALAMRVVMLICSMPGLVLTMTNACRPRTESEEATTMLHPALAQAD